MQYIVSIYLRIQVGQANDKADAENAFEAEFFAYANHTKPYIYILFLIHICIANSTDLYIYIWIYIYIWWSYKRPRQTQAERMTEEQTEEISI